MIPDRLPAGLRELIGEFPPGTLQFEVGIQSFNDEVCILISRRQDVRKLEENFQFLRERTGVHIHADLIVGLPGESVESFAAGFDRLVALRPQEIQVGLLKRLRGTPIVRHDAEWLMVYSAHPPYEILRTRSIDFSEMQRMRRFARYWDLVGNSGNFPKTSPLLLAQEASPFQAFALWSEWLHQQIGRTDGIALTRLMHLLFTYLTGECALDPSRVAIVLWDDYQRGGRKDKPSFLLPHLPETISTPRPTGQNVLTAKRQARHLG